MRKDYAGMVEAVDAGVGQLMAAIDKHQLAEDTLFVVTNDNDGERLSDNSPFFQFDLASDPASGSNWAISMPS